ncbi:MAG: thiamine-phosphate kinase [Candidatus Omnitrophica bacterium]|nr:thiamine-phosphate kinase [Candidatus Omnitrophota bacterium]
MKIRSVGEFGLIERVKNKLPGLKNAVLGIGDDCAVINYTKDKYLLLTVDMLIEGIHFDLRKFGARKVGRKALAVSLSDIAAMGGIPKYCLISIGMPANTPLKTIDDFYAGFLKLAKEYGVELIGGDTNRAQKLICDVCVIGEIEKKFLKKRSGAKIGDKIYVTGALGGSIKGRQYDFTPRVIPARVLVRNFQVNSMIDISDGLSSDLVHITESGNVGAVIYESRIPVSRACKSVKEALADGEDFELLFTMPQEISEDVLGKRLGVPVRMIGEIRNKREGVRIIDKKGKKRELKTSGYKHF